MNFTIYLLLIHVLLSLTAPGSYALRRFKRIGAKSGIYSAASRYNDVVNRATLRKHQGSSSMMLLLPADTDDNADNTTQKKEPNFWSGLAQLMTMGAGAPSLGEFKEFKDGKAMFRNLKPITL